MPSKRARSRSDDDAKGENISKMVKQGEPEMVAPVETESNDPAAAKKAKQARLKAWREAKAKAAAKSESEASNATGNVAVLDGSNGSTNSRILSAGEATANRATLGTSSQHLPPPMPPAPAPPAHSAPPRASSFSNAPTGRTVPPPPAPVPIAPKGPVKLAFGGRKGPQKQKARKIISTLAIQDEEDSEKKPQTAAMQELLLQNESERAEQSARDKDEINKRNNGSKGKRRSRFGSDKDKAEPAPNPNPNPAAGLAAPASGAVAEPVTSSSASRSVDNNPSTRAVAAAPAVSTTQNQEFSSSSGSGSGSPRGGVTGGGAAAIEDDDASVLTVDPLDAFMHSLHGIKTGDEDTEVESGGEDGSTQEMDIDGFLGGGSGSSSSSSSSGAGGVSKLQAARVAAAARSAVAATQGTKGEDEPEGQESTAAGGAGAGAGGVDKRGYNPYGSNFITAEMLADNNGWESDANTTISFASVVSSSGRAFARRGGVGVVSGKIGAGGGGGAGEAEGASTTTALVGGASGKRSLLKRASSGGSSGSSSGESEESLEMERKVGGSGDSGDEDDDAKQEEDRKLFMESLRAARRQQELGGGPGKAAPSSVTAVTTMTAAVGLLNDPSPSSSSTSASAARKSTEKKTGSGSSSSAFGGSDSHTPADLAVEGEIMYSGDGDLEEEGGSEARFKKSALELLEEKARGKVVTPIDHTIVQYSAFRKNLFILPRSLARLSDAEIVACREDLQIKVRGQGCPPPVESWEQCGLSERTLTVLANQKITTPFPVQKQAIPAIMAGRDVIAVAKTGSGKTLAFLLPLLRHVLDQPPLAPGDGPIALVMAPARELAFQINSEAKRFAKSLGLGVACIYGGAGVVDQIADLKRGSEIVVCTPGRFIELLCMQAGKLLSLKRVTMVVMDEADRMFDMGFEPQIQMILQNVRPDRQTVLFSATFPKQIERLAKGVLKFPLEIIVGERSSVNKDIRQIVEVREEADKFMRLLQLLGIWYDRGSTLVFVDKQEKCDQLFHELLKSGYPSLSLHGGMDQVDRDHTLHEFKTGVKKVMVATSVAGRGLDCPEVACVINYSSPNHLEDYVHRVGRTGRAGRKGTAYTFLVPCSGGSLGDAQLAPLLVKQLQRAGQPIPEELTALCTEFKERVARGEAKFAAAGGGFVGTKGFKFDETEISEQQRQQQQQKKSYEIEQGMVAAPDAFEDEEEGAASSSAAAVGAGGAEGSSATATAVAAAAAVNNPTATATTAIADVASSSAATDATVRARLLLAGILSQPAASTAGETKSKFHFTDEFVINDYPPNVRRRVTVRASLDEVCDLTGVNIIAKGQFISPARRAEIEREKDSRDAPLMNSGVGKDAKKAFQKLLQKQKEDEKGLYLLIEGPTEMGVKKARHELSRLLEEETMRQGSGISGMGRYSVL
jgi:ATP-dependent RNA helicase DDX46/PRP5